MVFDSEISGLDSALNCLTYRESYPRQDGNNRRFVVNKTITNWLVMPTAYVVTIEECLLIALNG